jgi:hypothetical protein
LLDILESFAELVGALDHYTRKGPNAPDLVDLIDARNSAQHRLLSQLPAEVEMSDADSCVHQVVRLATLIFSDMVIFPLPAAQRLKPRLAGMLQQTLEMCHLHRSWTSHAPVLLWALTLGTIATRFSETGLWYNTQLRHHLSVLQITTWSTLESICMAFLWWQPVCNGPAQSLWNDMFSDG